MAESRDGLLVDIKKDFGGFKLNVNFEAESGKVLGLLGASGCGKSMSLRCIAGIVKPDSGRIVLNGNTLFDSEKHVNLTPQKRHVGLLFQNYALFPNMTAWQNIMVGGKKWEPDREKREERCRMLIDKLSLAGLEKHRPHELSGGQQQRVALARILMTSPDIIMLDEPFSALDTFLRWQTELEISNILKNLGITTLLVSHSKDEVYRMCDKVCVITAGRSEKIITTKELFENPTTISAAFLSGLKNYSAISKIDDHHVKALDWNAVLETEQTVEEEHAFVGIRSEDVTLTADASAPNAFSCMLVGISDDISGKVALADTGTESGRHRIMAQISDDCARDFMGVSSACVLVPKDKLMLFKA